MAYMSGQEYESAAEKIVENYMGEYMDQYMQVPGSREVHTEEYLLAGVVRQVLRGDGRVL